MIQVRSCCSMYHNSLSFSDNNIPLYIYMFPFSIHSFDGHLACFHLLAVVSNVAVNIGVRVLVCVLPFNSLGHIYPEVQMMYATLV